MKYNKIKQKVKDQTTFPDLENYDVEEFDKDREELLKLSNEEKRRFAFANPLKHNDFSNRRMFWGSVAEIWARIFIIATRVVAIILTYFIFHYSFISINKLSNNTLENTFQNSSIKFETFIVGLFVTLTCLFSLLHFIPMAICRTAGSIFGWGIANVIMAILYFIINEILCVIALIYPAIASAGETIESSVPILIIFVLIVTITQIIGGCILIFKSDDIKRKIGIE